MVKSCRVHASFSQRQAAGDGWRNRFIVDDALTGAERAEAEQQRRKAARNRRRNRDVNGEEFND